MTTQEMTTVTEMQQRFASIDEIAAVLGIHATTLRRRLLVEESLVIETVKGCRLVPLSEYQERQKKQKD